MQRLPRWLRTRGSRRRLLRRLVGVLLIGVSAYFGGIAATSLVPTQVETQNYLARVRLTPLPALSSTVHAPTLLGDIDIRFDGPVPAPGIEASVEVKDEITSVLADRNLSVASLRPSSAEISAAISSGLSRLAVTFLLGLLAVTATGLGLLAYGRQRRLTWHHVALAGGSALAVAVTVGMVSALTYRPANLAAFRTTGVLTTLRDSAGLLGEVETRARQATPYVRNLLALSEALEEQFNPADVEQPTAARLLLVSDIHGANQYPLMKQIVQEQRIDAVIDSGDLLNFGNVLEADFTGIFTAIADLGVPYLFARGNHDANSPTDQALLRRMSSIPNVILLQPQDDVYHEVSVRGIRVTGFNDPRYFGDDNVNNTAEQQPATEQFLATFAERDPDLVVSHEAGAVADLDLGRVRVHGHLHARQLDGNLIGVGTFTGGGTVKHFVDAKDEDGGDAGELSGQKYAFDIAEFGESCALTSLTRYTYQGLISGQPAYDDVSVISGRSIQDAPPAEDRTCSAADGISSIPITARVGEADEGPAQSPTPREAG